MFSNPFVKCHKEGNQPTFFSVPGKDIIGDEKGKGMKYVR